MTRSVNETQSAACWELRSSTWASREWSSTATWAYVQPARRVRWMPSLWTRLPTCQKRPSCLMSRCTSSPTAAYSYRFAAGRGWRCAREQPCRQSTRQIVDAGQPNAADKPGGPPPDPAPPTPPKRHAPPPQPAAATPRSALPPPPTADADNAWRPAVDPATPPNHPADTGQPADTPSPDSSHKPSQRPADSAPKAPTPPTDTAPPTNDAV